MCVIRSSSSRGVCAKKCASGEETTGASAENISDKATSAIIHTENTPEASFICRFPSITEIVTAPPTPIAKPMIRAKYSTGRLREIAVMPSISIMPLTSILSTIFPSYIAMTISTPGMR